MKRYRWSGKSGRGGLFLTIVAMATLCGVPDWTGTLLTVPAAAQDAGKEAAEKEAFEASKELGTIEAWEAFLTNYPTGFRADLARAYVKRLADSPGASPPAAGVAAPRSPAPDAPSPAEETSLTSQTIEVGKWPERAAFDGRSLWVSESGTRSIVEIDVQRRRIGNRHKVGRLPVDMVATENGVVYALARTDNTIFAVPPDGKAGDFAEVPRCAELMSYAENNLFVVSNLDCSAPSVLTRVSHLNGRSAKIADVAAGPTDMKAAHSRVYIAHGTTPGRAPFVSVFDPATGSGWAAPDLPIHYPRLAANETAVFVGGAPLNSTSGIVIKLDAGQSQYGAQRQLPEPVAALAAGNGYVVAAGRQGTLFVLAAGNLSLLRTIHPDVALEPHDVVVIGNTLAVVSSRGNNVASDNIVAFVDGWMPGSAATFAQPPREAAPAPRTPDAPPRLVCAKGYKKVRGECVMLQNCGANAYRSPEGDCYCNNGYEMKSGKCVRIARKQPVRDNCPGDSVLKNGKCVKENEPGYKPPVRDNCPGDSVLKNGKCVKEAEPDFKPPVKCTGGQLYSLSQQKCVCQDGLKWNGQRCYLP
ncbi:MAG: hypothetical protein JNM89_13970 [Hyphomicrobiaceae bacterium]|nr:hypothetical protein [Hyphomicrobiaceae bacterium]